MKMHPVFFRWLIIFNVLLFGNALVSAAQKITQEVEVQPVSVWPNSSSESESAVLESSPDVEDITPQMDLTANKLESSFKVTTVEKDVMTKEGWPLEKPETAIEANANLKKSIGSTKRKQVVGGPCKDQDLLSPEKRKSCEEWVSGESASKEAMDTSYLSPDERNRQKRKSKGYAQAGDIQVDNDFEMGEDAQSTTEAEEGEEASTRPDNIETLHSQQIIDQEYEEAKKIPLPQPSRRAKIDNEVLAPLLTSEQILNMVIKPEAREKRLDLDFDETNLDVIMNTIGEAGGINIMLDPSLRNNVLNVHLKQVTIPEALNLLADSYNLAFKKVGDSLFVTTKERIRTDNLTSKLIKLRNIKGQEVKDMAKDLLDTINVSEDTNSLVVIGTPDEIKKIEDLVKKVDVPQPQVVLEARVIEVNKDALKDLGVDWSDTLGTGFQETSRNLAPSSVADAEGSPFKIYGFDRTPIVFNNLIRILENDNKAKVLSNPRVITLNNQESEIFVGDRIPYTITTVTGGVATTEVRFVEPGIRLKITPSIIDEEFVVIKIEPEVSFIFSFRGPDDQYPWVKTRNATAFVRVKDRQPFVLGGLLTQEDKKNFYKVPMLGSVPLLGNLFSYQKHTVNDTELIITVTPVIIKGDG